jgi:hypothetical protein
MNMHPLLSRYDAYGIQAQARLTFKKRPAVGDSVTIAGITYTFGTVDPYASLSTLKFYSTEHTHAGSARALTAAINADPTTFGLLHNNTLVVQSVFAVYYGIHVLVVASIPGTTGNSISISSSNSNAIEASAATLLAGADGPGQAGGGGSAQVQLLAAADASGTPGSYAFTIRQDNGKVWYNNGAGAWAPLIA